MSRFRDIAITGASGGLGRALAIALAAPDVTLHLTGRDTARLTTTAATCRALGATITETIADVTDAAAMERWITSRGPPDLVIANAGISGGPGPDHLEPPATLRAIFATNIDGVFNTVLPALAQMATQPPGPAGQRGRIAIIGSIAGLIALPTAPAYSASKAALDFWVTATTPNAAKAGIGLTIIRPGFIRTGLTADNRFTMPGLMDADAAAAKIVAGLNAGRSRISFPLRLLLLTHFGQTLPKSLFAKVKRKT